MRKYNILYSALCIFMTVNFSACDLTEEPTSYYGMDNYFTTADKARMAVVGIYDCLETEGYYGQYILGKPANGMSNRAIYQPATP